MTAVCCAGRCMGCCGSRRALARRARLRALLPVLLVLLGAGGCTAWAGSWPGWMLPGAVLCACLQDVLGRRAVLAISVPLQVAGALLHALLAVEEHRAAAVPVWAPTAADDGYDDTNGTTLLPPGSTRMPPLGVGGVLDGAPPPSGWLLGARMSRSACAGAALGMALPAALFYLAEVWPARCRGAACCVPAIAVVLGRTLAYGLDHAFDDVLELGPRVTALVCLAPACLGLMLLLLVTPPSPYWLALTGRDIALRRVLARLRGYRDERGAREEAEDIVDSVREQRASLCARNWRGPLLALLLAGLVPLVGVARLEAHLVVVLLPLDLGVDPASSAWLVRVASGAGLLFAFLLVAVLVDRCGRRPMLLSAALVLSAGHATLGYFHRYGGLPAPNALAQYITLGAVAASAVAGASLAALAWVVVAEVLPMRAKLVVPALVLLADGALQATLRALDVALRPPWSDGVEHYSEVERAMTPRLWAAYWCWAHALWCLLLAAVVTVAVPETMGMTLPQLHEVFKGPNRRNMQTRL